MVHTTQPRNVTSTVTVIQPFHGRVKPSRCVRQQHQQAGKQADRALLLVSSGTRCAAERGHALLSKFAYVTGEISPSPIGRLAKWTRPQKRLALPGGGNTKGGQGQHPISNTPASDQDKTREGIITGNCKRWLGWG